MKLGTYVVLCISMVGALQAVQEPELGARQEGCLSRTIRESNLPEREKVQALGLIYLGGPARPAVALLIYAKHVVHSGFKRCWTRWKIPKVTLRFTL